MKDIPKLYQSLLVKNFRNRSGVKKKINTLQGTTANNPKIDDKNDIKKREIKEM